MSARTSDVTSLLIEWANGSETALEMLMPLIYDELHRIARRLMRSQRPGHTLQTTALINEAYIKLVNTKERTWESRRHFLAVAATTMRNILIDHARSRVSAKRGGGFRPDHIDDAPDNSYKRCAELLDLDQALKTLADVDLRKSRVVDLRYFAGLTEKETADVLGVSCETIKKDWRFAKIWLARELSGEKSE